LGSANFGRHKLNAFRKPTETMFFCDGTPGRYSLEGDSAGYASHIDYRHNGGANVLYLDGHVGWRQSGSISFTGGTPSFWQ
jgi:prepilin-type processing-associated H-X9-DG protein